MSSVCAEQQLKFHPSHHLFSLKKSLRDIEIPPRKLLTRRAGVIHDGSGDMFSDETLFQKHLPHNNSSDDSDPYCSDHFRMFEFKVRQCTRSRSHDWTDCPCAHPGEKARRRDPRLFHYSGAVCPDYRRGSCSRGDACEFSHGVFECWLHPSRYRTEACKDGKNCKRKVCFFAHTPRELRVLPPDFSCNGNMNINSSFNIVNNKSKLLNKCCYCHCSSSTSTCSPTSTLFNMSHFSSPSSSSSPPMSPSSSPSSSSKPSSPSPTLSRFVETSCGGVNHHHSHRHFHDGVVSCKDVVNDVICSLEGLNFGEASPVSASKSQTLSWLDVSLNYEDLNHSILSPSDACEDHHHHHHNSQKQFILSPTLNSVNFSNGKLMREENKVIDDVTAAPDLGWVNELLM